MSMSTRYSLLRRYFDRTVIESSFARGIVRDLPRHAIPAGGSYDLLDYLVDKPGLLYKRGGTGYQSAALSGEDDITGIAAPEFPGDPRVVAFAATGASVTAYDITTDTPGSGQDLNGALTNENPPLYVDRLIVCDGLGTYTVQKIYLDTGTVTVDDLGGSPPSAKYSCVHAGRLVLANSNANPGRVWFSDPVDAENAWDLTEGYIDVSDSVTGLASVQGVLLVFSRGGFQRILGDIPPGYGTTSSEVNMSLQPGAQIGCIDARSIVAVGNEIVVANEDGVFLCTGAGVQSLTTKQDGEGIGTLWSDTIRDFAPAVGAVVACGVFRDYLFVTVYRSYVDADPQLAVFACYLPSESWTRLSDGCGGFMYATRFAPSNELYFAVANETDNRARAMSPIFTPDDSNPQDADGTDIQPVWESRVLGLEAGIGVKHYDDGHLTYRQAAPDHDTISLSLQVAVGIEADGSYSDVGVSPYTTASDLMQRRRFTIGRESQGVSVKVEQTGSTSRTELAILEALVRPLEPGDGS